MWEIFFSFTCILQSEYHTINNLTINTGTLRLITVQNSNQHLSCKSSKNIKIKRLNISPFCVLLLLFK